jgi:CRP-like cAMP-binding protein
MKMCGQDFRDFSIFEGFSKQQLDLLAVAFEPCRFAGNTTIIEQGQPTDFLYILASGKVIIRYKPYDGTPFTFATIEPGDVFGWSMALGRPVYTSAAIAEQDCQAYRISKARLVQMCDRCPEAVSELMNRLVNRIIQRAQSAQGEILNILMDGIDRNGNCVRRLNKNGKPGSKL